MTIQKLGKYEIHRLIGRGASGSVYEGWDPELDRKVALKVLAQPADEEMSGEHLERFRRGARAAARLQHPNVVSVYTFEAGAIVMEYIDGETLSAFLARRGAMKPAEALPIMEGILAGLEYSHEQGIIHRDIKPSNVMLTKSGLPKIADFGVAHFENSDLTRTGTVIGTPAYMSPEQITGNQIDRRTDIYSAGAMLYQMLTGKRPFEGATVSIMHKIVTLPPPLPSKVRTGVSPALDAIVAKAMAKQPEARYRWARDFAQALRLEISPAQDTPRRQEKPSVPFETAILRPGGRLSPRTAGPEPARRSPEPPPARKRRAAVAPIVAGVGAVLLAGAAWAYLYAGGGHSGADRPAVQEAGGSPPPAISPPPKSETASASQGGAQPGPQTPASPPPGGNPPTPPVAPTQQAASALPQAVQPDAPQLGTVAGNGAGAAAASTGSGLADKATPVVAPNVAPPIASPPAASPPVSAAVLRDKISAAAASAPCSLIGGNIDGTRAATLNGISGNRSAEQTLSSAVSTFAPDTRLNLQIQRFDNRGFCDALETLRPVVHKFGPAGAGVALSLADGRYRLTNGETLKLRVTTPDFPAYLQVDYLSHDGTVLHLVPSTAVPNNFYAPHSEVRLGGALAHGLEWKISGPSGTDMIMVIASSTPLFVGTRRPQEQMPSYLSDLSGAIAWGIGRGERLSGDAILLETRSR